MIMVANLIASLVNCVCRLASAFHEKPSTEVDDFELEHLLIYHGLVGSSPEDERRYRDVRADILGALKSRSSLNLAIALRLPPLYWESKLKTIFDPIIKTNPLSIVETLLPAIETKAWTKSQDPLRHEDWRGRANAARGLGFF